MRSQKKGTKYFFNFSSLPSKEANLGLLFFLVLSPKSGFYKLPSFARRGWLKKTLLYIFSKISTKLAKGGFEGDFFKIFAQIAVLFLTTACSEDENFAPKPKGFNYIALPENTYQSLDSTAYPYYFEYSKEAIIRLDSSFIAEPYWIHIIYPKFGKAEIQITYKDISDNPQKKLAELIDDSHRLASKHLLRAEGYGFQDYTNAEGKPVAAIGLVGEVPSHLQFYTTDSTKHFLRAAIYFRSATENDSLAPLIDFVKKDMIQMIRTQKFVNSFKKNRLQKNEAQQVEEKSFSLSTK